MTLRSAIKRLPFAHAAVHGARAVQRMIPKPPRPAILMYHRVADDPFDPWGLAVTPARFAEQLDWLSNARIVLPLPDFIAAMRAATLPDRAVAITFDDGYACSAEVAAPLLKHRGLTGTVFLPAQLIERGQSFWWDELGAIVFDSGADSLRVERKVFTLGPKTAADRRWPPGAPPASARQAAFFAIWEALRTRPPQVIAEAMADLKLQAGNPPSNPATRLLRPEVVRAASASDTLDFGSHALTHPSLPALSPEEQRGEIHGSVAACERLSGRTPRTFAYPFGDHDRTSAALVEEAGFLGACTTENRAVRASTNAFALPRVAIGNWGRRALAGVIGG